MDEVFVKINGKEHYLWRAVDQHGEVVDEYLQAKLDGASAKRIFKRLLRSHGSGDYRPVPQVAPKCWSTNELCALANGPNNGQPPIMKK
ncbi:MAG: DDE-type integrase/transposase/recombinase [Halioglobus sp.]